MALLERTRVDEAKVERLQKEQDDPLQTIEVFRMERDLSR